MVETQNADREALHAGSHRSSQSARPGGERHRARTSSSRSSRTHGQRPRPEVARSSSRTLRLPVVNVTMPGTKKTVKFTRNLQGEVEQAEIAEELDGR